MTVKMFNQAGDCDHIEKTMDLEVCEGGRNNDMDITYDVIENPPWGVKYLVNDKVSFRVDVRL